jgi:hypothetical protein
MKTLTLAVCLFAGAALAQQKIMIAGTGGAAQNATFQFISMDDEGGKVVTGAPYSAQIVSENNQTLSDGTHISRKNTSTIYRDSSGRTRREMTLPAIGNWAADGGQPPTIVTITDPVTKESYTLHSAMKTANKTKMREGMMGFGMAGGAISYTAATRIGPPNIEQDVKVFNSAVPPPPDGATTGQAVHIQRFEQQMLKTTDVKSESLGRQTMEGLAVDGTRTSHTIPEGQVGNDRPLTTTTEQWYSPDLQVTVMRKTVDPQMGENTYRLTNINRTEPDATLFQVPADYKVEEGGPMMIRKQTTITK